MKGNNQPKYGLEGKVAIVTGASGGIGRVVAKAFAEQGVSVALVSRTWAQLEALAEDIKGLKGRAFPFHADVTRRAQVLEMTLAVLNEFERIDILVNCAGGGKREPILDITEESWNETIDLNLKSVFLCCQSVGRTMIDQKSGSIVNYSSAIAQAPIPGEVHYAAAKAGVLQLTRVLAAEWGQYNVRVNCITPGLVDDKLGRMSLGAEFERVAAKSALKRAAVPEDMIGMTLFLASDSAAYISGININVTGGPV